MICRCVDGNRVIDGSYYSSLVNSNPLADIYEVLEKLNRDMADKPIYTCENAYIFLRKAMEFASRKAMENAPRPQARRIINPVMLPCRDESFTMTEAGIEDLQRKYPELNVYLELRRMAFWMLENTKPLRRDLTAFIRRWLDRSRADPGRSALQNEEFEREEWCRDMRLYRERKMKKCG